MNKFRIAVGVAVLGLAFPVLATSTPSNYVLNGSFTTTSGTSPTNPTNNSTGYKDNTGTNYGNVVSFTGSPGSQSVIVSAFGSTGAYVGSGTTGYDRAIETAYIAQYGANGLGVTSQSTINTSSPNTNTGFIASAPGYSNGNSKDNNELLNTTGNTTTITQCSSGTCYDNATGATPEHTIDNSGGYESLLFNFQSAVKLTSLSIGFPSSNSAIDSDATVLAYTPTTGQSCTGAPTLVGLSYQQLVTKTAVAGSGCWSLVGHDELLNIAGKTNETALLTPSISAQYWMVGAYMNIGSNVGQNTTYGNDGIKLSAVGVNRVPEPSTIALFGIAGAALIARRRRAAKI